MTRNLMNHVLTSENGGFGKTERAVTPEYVAEHLDVSLECAREVQDTLYALGEQLVKNLAKVAQQR